MESTVRKTRTKKAVARNRESLNFTPEPTTINNSRVARMTAHDVIHQGLSLRLFTDISELAPKLTPVSLVPLSNPRVTNDFSPGSHSRSLSLSVPWECHFSHRARQALSDSSTGRFEKLFCLARQRLLKWCLFGNLLSRLPRHSQGGIIDY